MTYRELLEQLMPGAGALSELRQENILDNQIHVKTKAGNVCQVELTWEDKSNTGGFTPLLLLTDVVDAD